MLDLDTLIAKLETIREKHGNVEMIYVDPDGLIEGAVDDVRFDDTDDGGPVVSVELEALG